MNKSILLILTISIIAQADSISVFQKPFSIFVCSNPINISRNVKIDLKKIGIDSTPFLTIDDIEYYLVDYATGRHVFILNKPFIKSKLEKRLHDFYGKPFVVMVAGIPAYGGEFLAINNHKGFKRLFERTFEYEGPYIEIPLELNSDTIEIKYLAQDSIYYDKDDPRLDERVSNIFRKINKFKATTIK
jgi:hypothetical protein